MSDFRKLADEHGICEMAKDWDDCKSNKQLLDLALSARGLDFVAQAVAEGWGISPDEIGKTFAPFINGRYVRAKDGFTSALYCSCPTDIDVKTTALLVINFQGTINIPVGRISEIYLVNSKCAIKGKGRGIVFAYGDTDVLNKDTALIKYYVK